MKLRILSFGVLALSMTAQAEQPMPTLAAPYQTSFQAAWNQVSQAELPVYECTQVVGIASREVKNQNTSADANRAYKACYVDSILRYSETYFQKLHHAELAADGKPYGCDMYARYLQGHVGSLEVLAERFGYEAHALNQEILSQLDGSAARCNVQLP